MRPLAALALLVCAGAAGISCNRYSDFVPKEPSPGHLPEDVETTPVVLVAKLVSSAPIGSVKTVDNYYKAQLYRLKATVETVLKGRITEREIGIYYFGYASIVGGPVHIGMSGQGGRWMPGDRLLFFLSVDLHELRTVCDFYDECVVHVFSGPHRGFVPDPNRLLTASIVDLLLTRGDKTSDVEMLQAINKGRPWIFSMDRSLTDLAALADHDNSPEVRKAASARLSEMKKEAECVKLRRDCPDPTLGGL